MAFTSQSLALRAPVSLPGGRLAPSAGRVALRGRDAAAAFPSVVVVAAAAPAAASTPMAGDEAEKKEVKLWGGRFEEGVTDAVERFTESISYDWQLYKYDIMGSKAHATMLASQVSTVPPCSPSADQWRSWSIFTPRATRLAIGTTQISNNHKFTIVIPI
jgi:argininosuccinate lyase